MAAYNPYNLSNSGKSIFSPVSSISSFGGVTDTTQPAVKSAASAVDAATKALTASPTTAATTVTNTVNTTPATTTTTAPAATATPKTYTLFDVMNGNAPSDITRMYYQQQKYGTADPTVLAQLKSEGAGSVADDLSKNMSDVQSFYTPEKVAELNAQGAVRAQQHQADLIQQIKARYPGQNFTDEQLQAMAGGIAANESYGMSDWEYAPSVGTPGSNGLIFWDPLSSSRNSGFMFTGGT